MAWAKWDLHRWVLREDPRCRFCGERDFGTHPGRVPDCPKPGKTKMVPQQVLQNTGRNVGAGKMEKKHHIHPKADRVRVTCLFRQLRPGDEGGPGFPQVVQTSLTPDQVRGVQRGTGEENHPVLRRGATAARGPYASRYSFQSGP